MSTQAVAWTADEAQEREAAVGRRARVVLAVTTFGVFLAYLDVTIANVAFPAIAADFNSVGPGTLSWVLNAYNVVIAALLVPFGRIADRIGRKRMFLTGLTLFGFASLACGLAPDAGTLIGARIVQAVGAAAIIPSSLALLLPEFPAAKRAHAAAAWAAAGAVSAAAGPSVGGILVDVAGWRSAFLVNLALLPIVLVLGGRILREHRTVDARMPDAFGAAVLAVAVGALALAIVKAPDWGWTSPEVLAVFAGALALVPAIAWRSRTHAAPVLEPALLRVRSFAVANAAFVLFSMSLYALLLGNVLFLTTNWDYSVLEAGFAVTPGPLAAAAAAGLGGRLVARFGSRAIGVLGAVLFAVACSMYATWTTATPAYVADWLPAMLLSGVANGLVFAAITAASVEDLPEDRMATGTAVISCFRQIGAVLGIAGLIAVVGHAQPGQEALDAGHLAYWLMGAVGLGAGGVALLLPRGASSVAAPAVTCERPSFEVRHVALGAGHRIAYRQAGSGPVVVLVHGALQAGDSWEKVIGPLSSSFTVIAPDLMGHGQSDAPAGWDYTAGGHAGTLRDMLVALGHERATVVGHSFGGAVVMCFAWHYPERTEAIGLVAPAGFGRDVPRIMRLATLPGGSLLVRALASRASTRVLLGVAAVLRRVGLRGPAKGLRTVAAMMAPLRRRAARNAFFRSAHTSLGPGGQHISAMDRTSSFAHHRSVVVWGTKDGMVPPSHIPNVKATLPLCEVVLLDGHGHFPHMVDGEAVAGALATLKGVAAAA